MLKAKIIKARIFNLYGFCNEIVKNGFIIDI